MRIISSESLATLAQNLGTEPINIIEVQWVVNGNRIPYSDKDPGGKILELGGLDSVIQISGGSDSNELSLSLDDTDAEIKNLIDTNDANKRPVWVYQWCEGLDISEKFLIFRGEISSPLVWDEGARTVSFSVVSKIEDAEVGFSIEEGNFPQPPDDLIGKAWPLAFGTVCDIKALQATTPRQGILKSGVGISDFTLPNRICQAKYILCPTEPKGTDSTLNPGPILTEPGTGADPGADTFVGPSNPDADPFGFVQTQTYGASEECAQDRCDTIAELEAELAQQLPYEYTTITVIGGDKFPQSSLITLDIGGGKFTGTFSGEIFTIISRKHPEFDTTTLIPCHEIGASAYVRRGSFAGGWTRLGTGNTWAPPSLDCDPNNLVDGPVDDGGSSASQKALDDMPTSSFFWASSGSRVTMDGEEDVLYIANLLPSTINRVSAFRRLAIGDKLMTLPDTMYDIFQTDYDGYIVTELVFPKLPSLVPNPVNGEIDGKWGDDVYVSLTSSVGPNTVDIIQYLIEKYTTFEIDSGSFLDVKIKLENYPQNFALLERKNVVEVLKEIVEQARCAIFVRDNTVFLKYLSEEPDAVATIEESDILANSLSIEHTSTEDIVTKYTANWQKSGAQEKQDQIVLRHNILKYGTQEDEVDYYTYNIREHVLKSATFWLIRKANTWRRVSFKTTIKHLALEIFDCITLDLPDVAPNPVKAVIEKASFDSENRTIDFECWTPLRAGTTEPYIFAWPAFVEADTKFPTQEEIDAGYAGSGGGDGFIMVPPPGHILSKQTIIADNRADWGDQFPSDLDDELIEIDCPLGPDVDLNDEKAPVFTAFKRAARASRQADRNAENAGAGGGGDNQDKKKDKSGLCGEEGETVIGECRYAVKVNYGMVVSVRGSDGFPKTSGCGRLINATFNAEMCHIFGSKFAAVAFVEYMNLQIQAAHAGTCIGANIPLTAINAGSAGGAPCAALEIAQGDTPGPNDKEYSKSVKALNEDAAKATGTVPQVVYPASSTLGGVVINTYVVNTPVPL
jgi:hypothetical protein